LQSFLTQIKLIFNSFKEFYLTEMTMARFQLDISDDRLKEIEELMALTNTATKKNL
jgi:hypothetical protein